MFFRAVMAARFASSGLRKLLFRYN